MPLPSLAAFRNKILNKPEEDIKQGSSVAKDIILTKPLIQLPSETYVPIAIEPYGIREEFSQEKSRTGLVQTVVDSLFSNFSLANINEGFFGEFIRNVVPQGYYIQEVGGHRFLIKEQFAIQLSSISVIFDKIKTELHTKSSCSFNLCYPRNLEGATMYALSVSEREIIEMSRSYPDLVFGYMNPDGPLKNIKLVVSIKKAG